ncbi:MAG: prolipoprotein diacylglyceryl transferase, partial [Deltaproteobacteria bacterium]|nr:prolipoprotein diacylglyceryl transferase [Deltaproteobacteria bacterium]
SQWREGLLGHPSLPSLPVWPTQLFEAGGSLLIAFVAWLVLHPRKTFHGQVFCLSMALYALLRFGIETIRADDRGIYGGLSTSQWISLFLLGVVVFVWREASRRPELFSDPSW